MKEEPRLTAGNEKRIPQEESAVRGLLRLLARQVAAEIRRRSTNSGFGSSG